MYDFAITIPRCYKDVYVNNSDKITNEYIFEDSKMSEKLI